MTSPDSALAELLCARLCHDMAGAVGAAAAGAELLEDGYDAETAQLVAASAAGAVARLKFFRATLGPSGPEQPAAAVRDLADHYLQAVAASGGGGLTLRWNCARPRLDGETARLVLNLVLIARDSLPRGGEIRVEIAAAQEGGLGLAVGFQGQDARLGDELGQPLVAGAPPDGPRGAQAWLARSLVEKFGGKLQFHQAGPEGRLTA